MKALACALALGLVACGGKSPAAPGGGSGDPDGGGPDGGRQDGGGPDGGGADGGSVDAGPSPVLGGCPLFPSNHLFNTPIDTLPAHPNSDAFLTTIGTTRNLHLDLGSTVDMTSATYYGIPYNLVHGGALTWPVVSYSSTDPGMSWDPRAESDCAVGSAHALVAPCTSAAAPRPVLPVPPSPLVEGGIDSTPGQPYGDHHMLLLDVDSCRLWELYHCYPDGQGSWDIFGSATWDLRSNALRPDGWTSSDAAGFPILPLLLRADEAASGVIRHALRFTIQSRKIRTSYTWPARHLTTNGTSSTNLPPMGQLFRLKPGFTIPAGFNAQSRAIAQALKTYGMYIADGGSDWFIQGEPSAGWLDATISQVQSISASNFEAVDLGPIMRRAGFSADSAAVP